MERKCLNCGKPVHSGPCWKERANGTVARIGSRRLGHAPSIELARPVSKAEQWWRNKTAAELQRVKEKRDA